MKRGASPSKGSSKKSPGARGGKTGTKTPTGVGKTSPAPGKLSPGTSAGKVSPGAGKVSPTRASGSRIPAPVKRPSPAVSEPDIREESGPAVEETYREEPLPDTGRSGIRYISEDLCKKIAKEDAVENITKLNLMLAKEGGKKIKYIENLERLRRLQVLSLSCNVIEKLEKLDKLTKLRELNLSFNKITTIAGLETLTLLQILNLTGNLIERIPPWMSKKLKALRVLRIAKNRLESLSEVAKLRPLTDLTQLTISDNPVSALAHSRSYTVFYLRTVEMLDGEPVTDTEREAANSRFSQDEVENLEKQLAGTERRLSVMQEDLEKTRSDMQTVEEKERGVSRRREEDIVRIEAMQREMETKDDLLRKKTSELTKACEKHYQLEQELAFYKIDHKFDSLGKPPQRDEGDEDTEGLIGESPYIGKARYRQNQYALETSAGARPKRAMMHTLPYGDDEIDAASMEQDAKGGGDDTAQRSLLHEVLDNELANKENAIERAQERLQKLQSQLQQTEDQVLEATEEFNKISAAAPIKILTEDDKAEIREKMVRKMDTVKLLKEEVKTKEDEMTQTELDMRDDQLEVDRLRDQLKRMDSKDSLYTHIKAQVADKEAQISFNTQIYDDLHQQLDSMLARITKETADIKRLEQQLREGQAAQNDELKAELEGIIAGLQDYLWNVKKQAEIQKQDYNDLLRQKEALMRKLQDMEGEMSMLETEASDYKDLQKRLADMEESLQDQQFLNATLQQQIQDSPGTDPGLDEKLDRAEIKVDQLQRELKEQRKQLQAEREDLAMELDEHRNRVSELEDQISQDDSKEEHIHDLSQRLADLEAENDQLRQQMRDQDSQMKDALSESIAPEELDHRLRDIVRSVEQGKPFMPAFGESDHTSRAMADLQRYLEDRINRNKQELDKSRQVQTEMENEIVDLRNQLMKASTPARKSTTGVQADLIPQEEDNTEDLKRMQQEIWRLRDSLKDMTPIQPTRRGPLSFAITPGVRNQGGSFLSDNDDTETTDRYSERHERNHGVLRSAFRPRRQEESDSDRQHHELYEPLDSDEQILFDEVAKELMELKRQIQDTDNLTNQQLEEAQDRMAELETELKRKEMALNKEQQSRAKMEAESLQKAMDDLIDAQDEIGQLQQLLEEKENAMAENTKAQETDQQALGAQKDEIDYLHDVLTAQKQEIGHLHDVIEGLLQRKPGKDHDAEMNKLKKEVDRLRNTMTHPQQYSADAYQTPYPTMTSLPVPQTQMPGAPPSQVMMSAMPGRIYTAPYQPGSSTWTSHPPGPLPAGVAGGVPQPGPSTTILAGGGHLSASPPGVSVRMPGVVPSVSYVQGVQAPMPGQPGVQGQVQQTGRLLNGEGKTLPELASAHKGEEILFCNVPEHHELEDLIAALQEKIKNLKKQIRKRERMLAETEAQGTRAVQMLTEELENKRDEMESLDLAIERQKVSLKQLKDAAGKVEQEKDAALRVLNELKEENEKRSKRRDFLDGRGQVNIEDGDYEYNYDPRTLQSRHSYLSEEVAQVEETLAKRKAELREAERLLKECEEDLHTAKNEAKDTIDRYDEARSKQDSTRQDTEELEKRAHDAGTKVIRCHEEIKNLQTEIAELEGMKHDLEITVEDINQVIGVKDDEFKSLDIQVKEGTRNLNRMLRDYGITEEKEREKLENMKQVEQDVAQKYAELDRLRMQIDAERLEMEQVDKEMGRLKTEHHLLKDSVEEKDTELRSLERDIEKEIGLKQRDIKELRLMIDQLQEQKSHYSALIIDEKDELQKVKMDVEREEHALHTLTSSIGKHKAELKHTLEMLQMEQTELNRINEQHRQKMNQLEKTQTMLTEEKEDLDGLQNERKKRQIDLDHLREVLDNEKMSLDRLETERRALETSISVMSKEKEILDENCKSLENKTKGLKRNQIQLEESIHNNKSKLNKVETELTRAQIELDEVKSNRSTLHEDVQILSQHVTDGKSELRSMRESIKVAEDHIHQLEQEMKCKAREKETMTSEVYRLEQEIQQRKVMVEEWTRQEKQKRDDMDAAQRDMDRITRDCNEAKKSLHKVSKELEKEEAKLSRVISNAHLELENLKTDLALKQDELEEAMAKVNQLKREAEQKQYTKERLVELEQTMKEKEREIGTSNDEKQQLAQALNRSYKELQSLREDVTQDKDAHQEQTELYEQEVEDLRNQLHDTVKELKQVRKKASSDITDLEQIAQDHCARANRLSDELNSVRQEYLNLKQQLITQTEIIARDKRLEDSVKELKTDLQSELSYSIHDLEKSRNDAMGELKELQDQKSQIQHTLDDLKENLSTVHHGGLSDFPAAHGEEWRKTAFKDKFAQEQDYLRQQLRQQMSRHEETLFNERQKSEGTLQSLKRRLSNLQDVLSNSDLTRARMSVRTPLSELNIDEPTSDISGLSPLSSPGKHSYMMSRPQQRSRSWDKIPEKGPTSPSSSYYSVA